MSFLHKDGRAVRTIDNFRMVPPQDGGWSLTPMENLLRGLRNHDDMVSLELFAADGVVTYLVRARHGESMGGVLHSYFPQARLTKREDDGISEPDPGDWLFLDEDEYALVTPLGLEREGYLPLRIFDDRVIEQSKMDPLAGVIGMLASSTRPGAESNGDRLGMRLLLKPAEAKWNEKWRYKIQQRRDGEDRKDSGRSASADKDAPAPAVVFGLGGLAAWAAGNYLIWDRVGDDLEKMLWLLGYNAVSALLGWGGYKLYKKFSGKGPREYIDEQLVEDKLKSLAFNAEMQIVRVFRNPADRGVAEESIVGLLDCLRSYDDPVGNSFKVGKQRYFRGEDLYQGKGDHIFLGGREFMGWLDKGVAANTILSAREAASLWHPPLGADEMASMERNAGGVLVPYLADLSKGGEDAGPLVGISESDQEIRVPESALRKHTLILGKSGVGKSTMVKHIVAYKLDRKAAGKDDGAIVVIDPHADLVRDILKMVPEDLADKVRLLDFGRRDRVPGINLVDPRLFPDRDRCVDTIVTTVKNLWEHWGGRLEDLLKRSLLIIYEFNDHADTAPDDMLTMLDILQLLDEGKRVGSGRDARTEASDFQSFVLSRVKDPSLIQWFNQYLGWSPELRSEAVGPVHSRVGAYASDQRTAVIMGQRNSTIMLSDVLSEGLVLLVSTAQGSVGIQPAALMGGTMVSLVESALRDQESIDPSLRKRCLLIADEFQTITGANWEGMLAEIRKYGCSLMLATQSLARLDTPERKLKAGILGNVGVMVGYNMSAEDAHILASEMDDDRVQPRYLVNLHPHYCYARISSDSKCYPAFSMKTLPPPDATRGTQESVDAVLEASKQYTVGWEEVRDRLQSETRSRINLDKIGGDLAGAFGQAAAQNNPAAAAPPAPAAPEKPSLADRLAARRAAMEESMKANGGDPLADLPPRPSAKAAAEARAKADAAKAAAAASGGADGEAPDPDSPEGRLAALLAQFNSDDDAPAPAPSFDGPAGNGQGDESDVPAERRPRGGPDSGDPFPVSNGGDSAGSVEPERELVGAGVGASSSASNPASEAALAVAQAESADRPPGRGRPARKGVGQPPVPDLEDHRPLPVGSGSGEEVDSSPFISAMEAHSQRRIERGPLRGIKQRTLEMSQADPKILEHVGSLPSSDPGLRAMLDKRAGDRAKSERARVRQTETARIHEEAEAKVEAEAAKVDEERLALEQARAELARKERELAERERGVVRAEETDKLGGALGVDLTPPGQRRDPGKVQVRSRGGR